MAAQWYFEKDHKRSGPFSEAEILNQIAAGNIRRDTLVWHSELGTEWQKAGDTGLREHFSGPPPLPAAKVPDGFAWVLAAIPIAGMLAEKMVESSFTIPATAVFLTYFAANTLVAWLDIQAIEKSGRPHEGGFKFWLWIVPVYLWQRATSLRIPRIHFWVWIAAFFGAAFLHQGKDILEGKVYWGLGVPACDSGVVKKQVKDLFGQAPLARLANLTAIEVTDIKQAGETKNRRTCTATFKASNAAKYTGIYSVDLRDDDRYYVELNINFF